MNLYEAFTIIKQDHLDLIKEHEECLVSLMYDLVPDREKDRKLLRVAQQYGVISYFSQGDKETLGEWLPKVRKTLEEDAFMAETWIRRTMTYLLYVYGYSDNTPESAFDSSDESEARKEKKEKISFAERVAPFARHFKNGEIEKAIEFALNYEGEGLIKTRLLAGAASIYLNDFKYDGLLSMLDIKLDAKQRELCKSFYNPELAAKTYLLAVKEGPKGDILEYGTILTRLIRLYTPLEENKELSSSLVSGIVDLIGKTKGKFRSGIKKELIVFVQTLISKKNISGAEAILMFWRLEGDPDAAFIEGALKLMSKKERTAEFYTDTLRIFEKGAENDQVSCMVMVAFCHNKLFEVTKDTSHKIKMRQWLEKSSVYDVETALAWLSNDYLKYRVNCDKAVELLRRLVALDYVGAKDVLAVCYLDGLGVTGSQERALELITQGVEADVSTLAFEKNNLFALYYIIKTRGLIESGKAKKEVVRILGVEKYSENVLLDRLLTLALPDIKDENTGWLINVNGR